MSDNPVPGAEGRHEETEQTTAAAAESVGPVLTQQAPTSQAEAIGSPEPEAPDGRANVNTSGAPKAQIQSPADIAKAIAAKTASTPPERGLRLLSLDGGGIRGLSELLILGRLMAKLQDELELEEKPRPADYFDLIGGTSTGGLIAILLGRLRLSVDEAIEIYCQLSKTIFDASGFSKTRLTAGHGYSFDADKLKGAVCEIVKKHAGNEDALMIESGATCRVFVTAVFELSANTAHLFRTYNSPQNDVYSKVKIWEAGRATSAATTYFAPMKIGPTNAQGTFLDSGIGGFNNPSELLLDELKHIRAFKGKDIDCIVSIGTGREETIHIPSEEDRKGFGRWKNAVPVDLLKPLKALATSCHNVHQRMLKKPELDAKYFRFDVDRGLANITLEKWEELGAVSQYTSTYLTDGVIEKQMESAARILACTLDNGNLERCLLWLSNVPCLEHHNFVGSGGLLNGSGDWLFSRCQPFMDWVRAGTSSLMWLHGIPGCGKSVLAYSVIEKMSQVTQVAYFYCHKNPQEPARAEPIEVLRAIVKQLARRSGPAQLAEAVILKYKKKLEPGNKKNIQLERLTEDECVDLIGRLISGMTVIVIDAVNECDATRRFVLFEAISKVVKFCSESNPPRTVKWLLTGQDDPDILARFGNLPNYTIKADDIADDLDRFIVREVDDIVLKRKILPGKITTPTKKKIIATLRKKAHGMFQLARQLMDILCNPMRIMRPEDVDAFLEILPEELMQSYSEKIDMIKKNLAPASRDMALTALMWLHCAAPMRPAEFLYAVSRIGNSSSSVPTTEEILKMCYNLVVFDGGLEVFRFAHPSVHDFLSLQEGYGHDAHCKALDTCLDVWSGLSIPSDHPLYEYATLYWPLHLQNLGGVMKNPMLDQKFKNFSFAEKKTETVETVYETKRQWMIFSKSVPRQRKVTRFRLELSPNFESWMDEAERLCLSLQTNDPYRSLLLESVSIRKTPIFLACTFGLLRILEIWDDGTRNIAWAVKNKNKNYPFKLACKLGNVAIVEYLLGRGLSATNGDLVRSAENGRAAVVAILMKQTAVDINASHPSMWQFWRSQTALIAAAAGGYDSVVEVLLRSPHINPNIATPFGRTALIAAAEQGHDLVAKMLIAEGTVNVNLQDSRGRTALAAAVNNDHPAIVESLIALPQISTDRPDHKDDTPLHLAAKKGLLHMVSILLTNRRISLDRKNKDGRTPLSWAAGEGFADVVEMLVHYPDVEVNSTCNSGRTPLSYAASYADSNVIDLLLAHEKIDADARDATGRTPLSWAASGLEVYSFSALYRQIASASPSQAPQLPFGSLKLGSTTTTEQMTSAQLNVGGLTFPLTSTALNARASTPSHSLHHTLLSLLKHKDVNVNSRDNAGQTPLSWAVQQRCTLAVAVLLLHPKIDAKLADNNGFTPEWHALDLGYQEILSMLRREKKVSLAAEDHPISTVRVAAISKPNFSVGAFSVRWDTDEKEGEQARLVTVDEEDPSFVDGEEQPM